MSRPPSQVSPASPPRPRAQGLSRPRRSRARVTMRKVEVNEALYRDVGRLVEERPELGYLDVGEFIREAVRAVFRKIDDK